MMLSKIQRLLVVFIAFVELWNVLKVTRTALKATYEEQLISPIHAGINKETGSKLPSEWNPRDYSDPFNLTNNLSRGLNIINSRSGCQIAAWVFYGKERFGACMNDCKRESSRKKLWFDSDVSGMRENDTVFVQLVHIEDFSKFLLPRIKTKFVLITGQLHASPGPTAEVAEKILKCPHLLHWFSRDVILYTGGNERNSKISPFPLGLKPLRPARKIHMNPIPTFRRFFLDHLQVEKSQKFFVSHLTVSNSQSRKNVPVGAKREYPEYLEEMAKSQYVLSPAGRRPECHRHYEAIALGTIPITELDPEFYGHLREGSVVYNNTNWNLTHLESTLPRNPPTVNRNMIFEEYWIEYVERTVGRPLRWWDVLQRKRCMLQQFSPVKDAEE